MLSRRSALLLALVAGGCAHNTTLPPPRGPALETAGAASTPAPRSEVQAGYATWYGAALAGKHTASGERFDPSRMTAAHRTLPFGTWVDVRRLDTGQSVRVRITDRGPFGHPERIIDLSRAAAAKIDMLRMGTARIELRVVAGP